MLSSEGLSVFIETVRVRVLADLRINICALELEVETLEENLSQLNVNIDLLSKTRSLSANAERIKRVSQAKALKRKGEVGTLLTAKSSNLRQAKGSLGSLERGDTSMLLFLVAEEILEHSTPVGQCSVTRHPRSKRLMSMRGIYLFRDAFVFILLNSDNATISLAENVYSQLWNYELTAIAQLQAPTMHATC